MLPKITQLPENVGTLHYGRYKHVTRIWLAKHVTVKTEPAPLYDFYMNEYIILYVIDGESSAQWTSLCACVEDMAANDQWCNNQPMAGVTPTLDREKSLQNTSNAVQRVAGMDDSKRQPQTHASSDERSLSCWDQYFIVNFLL